MYSIIASFKFILTRFGLKTLLNKLQARNQEFW